MTTLASSDGVELVAGTNVALKQSVVRDLSAIVETFVSRLKRRQISGSYACAMETLRLMREVISYAKWATVQQLIDVIREIGRRISAAQPFELAVGNMVKRVLFVVRDEVAALSKEQNPTSPPSNFPLNSQGKGDNSSGTTTPTVTRGFSMVDLLEGLPELNLEATPLTCTLKPLLIEAVNELIDEIEQSRSQICAQALEHIHANETVMSHGSSKTVEEFLKHAARKRQFSVIIVESAPRYEGHSMATSLATAGIDVTLITDAAVFAMMARVNKVILGTHTVMGNGGLIAPAIAKTMAMAAHAHHVPVVVCSAIYKLSPLFPLDTDKLCDLVSPESLFGFEEQREWYTSCPPVSSMSSTASSSVQTANSTGAYGGGHSMRPSSSSSSSSSSGGSSQCYMTPESIQQRQDVTSMHVNISRTDYHRLDVRNPVFDYIPPDFISIYVTNIKSDPPTYIYRLVSEFYHLEDVKL